jgi:O-antigen/teichoic acid export membrane protein
MLGGLGFLGYAAGSILLWILAYGVTLPPLLKVLGPGALPGWADWRDLFSRNTRQLGAVGLFSGLEFAIYNFPYLLVPLLYGKGWALVAFDVFYKITRFGAAGYLAVNEGLLPAATRAIHEGDAVRIRRHVVVSLALSAVACVAGAVGVTVFGDLVFGLLLHDASRAPHTLRICMAATLLAMMFQACAGVLMINTGKGPVLARVATGMGVAMALLAVVASFGLGFERFMVAYTVLFACGSAVYFTLLTRSVRRVSEGRPW